MSTPQVVSVLEVAKEVTEADAIAELTSQCAQVEPEVDALSTRLSADSQARSPGPPPSHNPSDTSTNLHSTVTRISQNSLGDPKAWDPLSSSAANATPPLHEQNSKKGRRVFFPSDEKIISGSTHPPSPWNDGQCILITLILN